jgi:hypothetical protein
MTNAIEDSSINKFNHRARWWLRAVGTLLGSALLAGRLILTVWVWERGPKSIGLSLGYGSGALWLAPFLFALILLALFWVPSAFWLIVADHASKRRTDTATLIVFGFALLVLGLLLTWR